MDTEEHLNKIIAKCKELLAGAEKRTQYFIKGLKHDKARDLMNEEDVEFGLSCAGPAEAGWRATIASIDALYEMVCDPEFHDHICDNDGRGCQACEDAEKAIKQIIAAWPEELL